MREISRIGSDQFQSTPSVWRETAPFRYAVPTRSISIHSLRMEGDNKRPEIVTNFCISIHSLRMEGDFWNADRKKQE